MMQTLLIVMMLVWFFVLFNAGHVFAQNETSHTMPSPPAEKYPYSSKMSSIFSTAEYVHQNEIVTVDIAVTNNADYPLFDLTVGESFNDSKYISLYDLHKINILEPNETKIIKGQMYVSTNVTPTDHFDVWWYIVAKNETGNMMESMQFHRDFVITQNRTFYDPLQDNNLSPPLQQIKQGKPFVVCKQNFQLVKRAESNGASVCVKPESMILLVKRGWAQNPLSDTQVPKEKQSTFFYTLMNYNGIRDWSTTGWKYMGYEGRSLPSGSWNDTFDLYLPPTSGNPKIDCNAGWHAWLTFDENTMKIVAMHYPTESQHICGETQYPYPEKDLSRFGQVPCDRECVKAKKSSNSVCYPLEYNKYYCVAPATGKSIVVIPPDAINPESDFNNFIPEALYVQIGVNSTVEWDNQGLSTELRSDQGFFNLDLKNKWSYTFDKPGTYYYHGERPWMHGEIVVKK